MVSVRTSFDLNPEQERTQAQEARTINLQRVGEKSQSESRIKILVYSVKRKQLHAHTCKRCSRTCPNTMTKNTEFFLFTVVFLLPFALSLFFSFLVFFSVPLSLNSFSHYILWFFYTISSVHVWVRCQESFFSVLLCLSLNLPLLAVRLLVHCSGITSTLMQPESQLGSI